MIYPLKDYTHLGYDYLDQVNSYTIHSGVDLNKGRPWDDLGSNILSVLDGYIVYIGRKIRGWGNMIVIQHSSYGIWSRYAHLDTIQDNLEINTPVVEGQIIGKLGNTGTSTAPHLHFDLIKELINWTSYTKFMSIKRVREIYIDPIKYIKSIQARDKTNVSEWARVSWDKAKKAKIITNSDPQDLITVEQLAVILDRLKLYNK